MFRLEEEEESARLIPVAGTLPLSLAKVEAIAPLEQVEPFGLVNYQGSGAIVPVPQWQAILTAVDPVAIFCTGGEVAETVPRREEVVLVIVDREQRDWNETSYFLVAQGDQLAISWFDIEPDLPLVGRVVVVLRPKKIFDANYLREPWQMDD